MATPNKRQPQTTRDWLGMTDEAQTVNADEAASVVPAMTLFDLLAGGNDDFRVDSMRVFTRFHERQTGIIVTVHAVRQTTPDEDRALATMIRAAGGDARASDVFAEWQRALTRPLYYTAVSVIPAGNVPITLIADPIPQTDE